MQVDLSAFLRWKMDKLKCSLHCYSVTNHMYLPLCTSKNLMWHTEMENLFYSSVSLTVLLNGNFPHLNQPSPKNNLKLCCHYVLPRPVQIQSRPSYYVEIGLCKLDTRGRAGRIAFCSKAQHEFFLGGPAVYIMCHHKHACMLNESSIKQRVYCFLLIYINTFIPKNVIVFHKKIYFQSVFVALNVYVLTSGHTHTHTHTFVFGDIP